MQISLVAVIDKNRGLGKDNHLLCHLPADLQHFKTITYGKPILMGRNTFESIGRPLPGRQNIVLTSRPLVVPGVEKVHSIEEALQLAAKSPELMVIGGERLFKETMNLASFIYLSYIDARFPADVFFPELDPEVWRLIETNFRPKDTENPYDLTFSLYKNQKII